MTKKSEKVKILMIESGSEMEMGIPPNIATLVSSVKNSGFEINIFSTNEFRIFDKTGDDSRIGSLQVPPTSFNEMDIRYKDTDVIDDFILKVEEFRPDIIGLSTTEANYKIGLSLLKSIVKKDIFIIVGGAFAILSPETIIKEDCIDAVCVGEGEVPLVELCQSIQNQSINYDISNIWFKKDGKIIRNKYSSLSDINLTPFQDWSEWDIPPRSFKPMAGKIRSTAIVELTRGCPFRCNYCANHFLNEKFIHNYREKSIDRFIDEVEYLKKKYNVNFIYIADETILTTSEKRFLEFINQYKKVHLPFWCETRPEFITYEKIKMLKDVGMESINVGLESGNEDFRKNILNRYVSNDNIIRGISEAIKADMRVGVNVIIGFPHENRDLIFETINLIREIKPTSTMVHLFQPYVRTPLREECIKIGIIDKDYICGDYRMDAIGTKELSKQEILGLHRTFNLYVDLPKDRWEEIKKAENLNDRGDIVFRKLAKEYQLKHFGKTSF